jgi:hypothetical protein
MTYLSVDQLFLCQPVVDLGFILLLWDLSRLASGWFFAGFRRCVGGGVCEVDNFGFGG